MLLRNCLAEEAEALQPEIEEKDMKAIRIHEKGGPEVLIYEDAPRPGCCRVTRSSACTLRRLQKTS